MVEGAGGGSGPRTGAENVVVVEEVPVPTLEDWAEVLPDPEDDANYRHRDALKKVHDAYNCLPQGWKRVRDAHGRHVFLHGPSGRTSFRNPARENVKRVLAEMEAENPKIWEAAGGEGTEKAAKIRKLRRMIKVGTPAHAVEHQAKMDGVDMDEVKAEEEEEDRATATAAEGGGGDDEDDSELGRLRKMLSRGVPLPAVRQQARLRGVDPDLVSPAGAGTAPAPPAKTGKKVWRRPTEDGARAVKIRTLKRMIKAGTPANAVEHFARIHGIDLDAVRAESRSSPGSPGLDRDRFTDEYELKRLRRMLASGVPLPAVQQQARMRGVDPDLLFAGDGTGARANEGDGQGGTKDDAANGGAAAAADLPLFRLVRKEAKAGVPDMVEFDPPDSLLASVVRGSVQTLRDRGRGRGGAGPSPALAVELRKDLYNALGNLRAARRERDEYNRAAIEPDDVRRALRRPLLERLRSIGARRPGTGGAFEIEGLDDLIGLTESECSDLVEARLARIAEGAVDFNSLGEWFAPGELVVARNAFAVGSDVLCEVVQSSYEEGRTLFGNTRRFRVTMRFVTSVDGAGAGASSGGGDGEGDDDDDDDGGGSGGKGKFAPVEFAESMESFVGARDVRTLPFVPLAGLGRDEAESALESFRRRGEMYARCVAGGATFLRYEEGTFFPKAVSLGGGRSSFGRNSHAAAQRAGGRVMIDCRGSYEAGHSVGVGYDPMVEAIKAKQKEYALYLRRTKQAKASASATASSSTSASGSFAGAGSAEDDDSMVVFSSLPGVMLAMTWPALVGFSFTSKAWGDVLVDGLSEIDFNESAFDRLVLPPARKRMIKALVRHSSTSFSDIVAGKGEGSVFLLYGPPGVGKTLTAEAMSEMLHRPLYAVSLGQLGTTPAELESRLGEILDLCGRWDALVLLDEADIFLEKRTSGGSSLERNAMVSVMLRLVEYFRGVLFLTSNRVEALDPAFKTRITLALRYDPLGRDARAEVWTNLLRSSGEGDAVDGGMIVPSDLARHELNGREIKNAVRLALALAEEDGQPLQQRYIEETAEILMEFNAKMEGEVEY